MTNKSSRIVLKSKCEDHKAKKETTICILLLDNAYPMLTWLFPNRLAAANYELRTTNYESTLNPPIEDRATSSSSYM